MIAHFTVDTPRSGTIINGTKYTEHALEQEWPQYSSSRSSWKKSNAKSRKKDLNLAQKI